MRRSTIIVMLCVLLLSACALWATPAVVSADEDEGGSELMVSAAMSLRAAFERIARDYELSHPGVRIVLNFSSSGKLRQQIEAGAPVDVFASASAKHMDMLQQDGHIIASSRRDFAGNTIVLAASAEAAATLRGFSDLLNSDVRRIAIGNPDSSPAGQYAKQTLINAGIWEQVSDKLVAVETVRQVLDYLARNEVEAGLLYATDAALNPRAVRVVASAPPGSHERIVYPIALVAQSEHAREALSFIAFVLSPQAQGILAQNGFVSPDE